ncbi:uncharacterized mitochondrial protein-like protein [Tanacetum coccineum]|uniref:Uncharacterized mitochondrial protein-like protein n=1 Tax=Tanacetum coccineum TaxID=301880 RepID=A0ABQ5CVD0_9ASTR
MVPRAVLMNSGLVSVNTARQVNAAHSKTTVNAARPKSHFSKLAHSTVKRPIHKNTAFKNSNFNQRVNTVNVVKASAYWVWKPKTKVLDHVSKHNSASITLKKFDYVDTQEIDGGMLHLEVTPKEGKSHAEAEAVNTACYVQNRVLVAKPHNKTLYELFLGRKPALGFMRPFGCPARILNTTDHLGKFDGKADEGFFVKYSINSKAFRVFNSRTRIVKENMHVQFSENTPNIIGSTKSCDDAGDDEKKVTKELGKEGGDPINADGRKASIELPDDPNMHALEDIVYSDDDEGVGAEVDMNNLDAFMPVSPIPTTRVHKDHPIEQIIRDLNSAPQTKRMTKNLEEHEVFQKLFFMVRLKRSLSLTTTRFEIQTFLTNFTKYKALFMGLHQAPRAWYESLSTYLLDNRFQRGKTNKTLFIKREKGELTFFLGLQVKQKEDGIFISQDKYVTEILKKFGFTIVKTASTPMETQKPLLKDEDGKEVDVHLYRSMIGSLMYLTSSRPDIMFAVCACARYQYPKDSPFDLVLYTDSDYAGASLDRKSITGGCQFLRSRLISWQCKKQTVVANSITEAEYVPASSCYGQATVKAKTVNKEVQLQALVDGKKVIITESNVRRYLHLEDDEGVDCLPNATIFEQLILTGSTMASAIICLATNQKFNFSKYIFKSMVKNLENVSAKEEIGEGSAMPTDPHHTPIIIQPSTSQPQKKQKPRKPTRKDTKVPQPSGPTDNVADEAVYEEMDDSLERVATTATSLDAKQDRGVNTPRSDEDRLKLKELMELCTNFQNRVIDLENIKTAQAQEITSLKLRVKKLEKKGGSRTHKLKRLYKVGRSARMVSSDEAKITLVDETHGRYGNDIMFDVSDLAGEEVFVAEQGVHDSKKGGVAQVGTVATTVSTASTIPVRVALITDVKITLAQALAELKSVKPTTTASTRPRANGLNCQRKINSSLMRKWLKGYKLNLINKQEMIKREKADKVGKANIALKETWDDIHAKIEADCLLAERLQAREQEELTIEERAKLFQQLLEKRRKFFAAKRPEEKRNKPPTRAQQRSIMSTYLKNMAGYKHNQLKNKSFSDIQKLFDKAMKRVNTFVDVDTKLVEGSEVRAEGSETRSEGSSKRAGEELEQESSKKQKIDDDQEEATMKEQQLMLLLWLLSLQPLLTTRSLKKERSATFKL